MKSVRGKMKLRSFEVRPEFIAEIKLRVSALPQQEVAYSHLSARANKQIQLGQICHGCILMQYILSDVFCLEPASCHLGSSVLCSLCDIPPAAIICCDHQCGLAFASQLLGGHYSFLNRGTEAFAIADNA